MVDVTARFFSFSGGLSRSSAPLGPSVTGKALLDAGSLLSRIRENDTTAVDFQEQVDELDREWQVVPSNPSVSTFKETVISMLYEEIRSALSREQQRAVTKLQREINIQRFFEPVEIVVGRPDIQERTPVIKKSMETLGYEKKFESDPVLDQEAEILLADYVTNVDQVMDVRRKVQETSALLSALSSKALEQQEMATSILEVASESIGHIDSAESELKKAIKHNDSYKTYLIMWFWLLTIILWVLHSIT
jgi:syntaxin 18